jgi:hypothetical protein
MRQIEVFYHLLVPPDSRASHWPWLIDLQLSLIRDSQLPSIAKINMCITMPKYWAFIHSPTLTFRKNKEITAEISFEDKVREYINLRYPFVNILDIRDTGEPNLFEGHTLKLLWDRCNEVDIDVLYIHGKGVISSSAPVANWRDILHHYLITKWPAAVANLAHSDVVGVKDATTEVDKLITSGNFWWSKSSHIRNLPDPTQSQNYISDPIFHPTGPSYRWAMECWIRLNNPSFHYLVDTKTCHFDDYCFLEDLIKLNP